MSSTPTPEPVQETHDQYAKPGALTPAGAEPIVRALGVHKYFGGNHVLRGATIEVFPRETVCLIGRSGSGKSTLLRCINFLEEPTMGVIEVDGLQLEAAAAQRARIAAIASRSARCGCAPRWCSRSSTCSRTSRSSTT